MWLNWLGAGLALLAVIAVSYVVQRYRIRRARWAMMKRGEIWLDQPTQVDYHAARTAQEARRKIWRAGEG